MTITNFNSFPSKINDYLTKISLDYFVKMLQICCCKHIMAER